MHDHSVCMSPTCKSVTGSKVDGDSLVITSLGRTARTQSETRLFPTHFARSVVCVSVSRARISFAKTDGLIKMPFMGPLKLLFL